MLNTHFRNLNKPMGCAIDGGKLAIGCSVDIWEFHNVPAVCAKLDASDDYPSTRPTTTRASCPAAHCTGDVQIHEMAYGDGELMFVNTAFSCLAKRSEENSFEPVWRPNWINQFAPGDNCHLNGLAVRDGQVKYVTALGETNEPGGWRENKRDGGLLIDVDSKKIIARGLSMPHSPRWYNGKLWVLESGEGTIGTVDIQLANTKQSPSSPASRGDSASWGRWRSWGCRRCASRPSSAASPGRAAKGSRRTHCGVWVLNIETGQTLGFCRFEEGVQEIFAVEVCRASVSRTW